MAVPHEKRGGGPEKRGGDPRHSRHQKWPEPLIKPRKPQGVLFGDEHRACGKMWRREKGWRGFDRQSGEFRLQLVSSGVLKGLFQRVLSEITFDGSVMGRLEGLQDQNREFFFSSFTEI